MDEPTYNLISEEENSNKSEDELSKSLSSEVLTVKNNFKSRSVNVATWRYHNHYYQT